MPKTSQNHEPENRLHKVMIGVMGPGQQATPKDCQMAYQLGRLIAQQGWVLLSGGRNLGVMHAASQGAAEAGGITVGILPSATAEGLSPFIHIPIVTGMGSGRNNINVLSSDVVVACGLGAGTASEIALAIKAHKGVILLGHDATSQSFFTQLALDRVFPVATPEAAIERAQRMVEVLHMDQDGTP